MVQYRLANQYDQLKIAQLHAKNWQESYRNAFTEDYLINRVMADRMAVWQKRFEKPNPNQHIILVEENNELIGFSCTYLKEDPIYGALLDNLHVSKNYKGKGIGKELMKCSAQWVYENNPVSKYYLWVLEKNTAAIDFYERLGGQQTESISEKMPDGEMAHVFRYVWIDLKLLM